MELSLFLHCPLTSILLTRTHKRLQRKSSYKFPCCCSYSSSNKTATEPTTLSFQIEGRRALLSCFLTTIAGVYACDVAGAVSTSRRALRGAKIPESDFTTLPSGLKYYDLKVGNGAEAVKGSRVAVRFTMLYSFGEPALGQRYRDNMLYSFGEPAFPHMSGFASSLMPASNLNLNDHVQQDEPTASDDDQEVVPKCKQLQPRNRSPTCCGTGHYLQD